jgi:YHYH protein
MKSLAFLFSLISFSVFAQTNPIITQWLRNTNGIKGRHYVRGNSTPIQDQDSANVKRVYYSTNWVYVFANGVPGYVTGPFLDGNPSITTSQNGIFKFPLTPQQNTGTPTATTGGNIGLFVNGVALFDYRDGVAWNPTTQALCGGPGNPPCPGGPGASMAWNRDAIVAEKGGFDCSKGHPAQGNYHHHQNPSAFKLDRNVISTVCNLYDADGLYVIDSTRHSPLIGFAYDGFPIYGAYAYTNTNGTGGFTRMKSGFQLKTMTSRTNGPTINATYPLGYFREDYEYIARPGQPDYLDEHNGRFCITPEYPTGTYAYFCTVDANWNSAYPYAVGPTFYGVRNALKVTSITEPVTTYSGNPNGNQQADLDDFFAYGTPDLGFIAVQVNGMQVKDVMVNLLSLEGKLLESHTIPAGSTITYLNTSSLHQGIYLVEMIQDGKKATKKLAYF